MGLRIPQGTTIALDTMVFIYHFEANTTYSPITTSIFEQIESGRLKAVTSYVTLLEILVNPFKKGDRKAVSDYSDLLTTFPNLQFIPLNKEASEMAASLRAKYSIKTPDAIQIATAVITGSSFYITNDASLRKVDEVRIMLLKDMLK